MGEFVASVIASPPSLFATQESVRALSTLPLPHIHIPLWKDAPAATVPWRHGLMKREKRREEGGGRLAMAKEGRRKETHAMPSQKKKKNMSIIFFFSETAGVFQFSFFSSLESRRKIRQLPDAATTNVVILKVGTILTKEEKKKNHLSGHFFLLQPLQGKENWSGQTGIRQV